MEISNPPQFVPYLITTDKDRIYCKIVEIPPWNMATTGSNMVLHGLGTNWSKIVNIFPIIYNDVGTALFFLTLVLDLADPSLVAGGIGTVNDTIISLVRRTGGTFDNVAFSSTANPRGKMLIWFQE
jgi:hypothetical protein